ncbi:ResB protein required for cytochrome c biosynthesis-like protein [Geobacter metallireducens RCH3]|uniref:ResB-like family cytochrome c n=1 Tax=Geobacter metallireducens (strain ATCC 53774 / DSM 7210 / GS-15) TaxID=269799 RepID=Q39Y59_GEOMG|nr:cytochrome c biogenesis protein ResB [Geobacter metallireducens]ABB30815.1 ResB-like family cytochrome c [Geobacter metallireducens GS-15]EHP88227.1 ResB protein required for cytochrome c biosynthesis-like protein [Geobacter metallireducens RCH3]
MKRFLLSRTTILALFALILGAIVLSYFVPQHMGVPSRALDKWRESHGPLLAAVDFLGLHHMFTTPWFATLLAFFLASLSLSTYQQYRLAKERTFRVGLPGEGWISLPETAMESAVILRKFGYVRIGNQGEVSRHVKHPWGYWGNFLLHVGIVLVVASSLVILVTQHRGLLNLERGETVYPGTPWAVEENGLFVGKFVLPAAVRLESHDPVFWDNGEIKLIESTVAFLYPDRPVERATLGINQPAWLGGVKIYQSHRFGSDFYAEFADRDGKKVVLILPLQIPPRLDEAGYGDFQFNVMPFQIKAKYYADAARKDMLSGNPLLVLRLYDGAALLGELPLRIGESGVLGNYHVRLLKAVPWNGLILVSMSGMPGIFFGFFIIVCGCSLNYFVVPREVWVREGSQTAVSWRAARFAEFYRDEYDELVAALGAMHEQAEAGPVQ